MNPRVLTVMSVAAGVSVANLYYSQPLLPAMAAGWNLSARTIASVVTLSQIGYATGMLLIVPVGDATDRRKLILIMLGITTLSLLAMASAMTPLWLLAASLGVGAATITPQLIIPFAAHLAAPEQRGRVVGTVMSGLLVGILLARTFSGALGQWFGWRAVYAISAVMMSVLALVLRFMLPKDDAGNTQLGYGQLLRSLIDLLRDEPVLRTSSFLGAMSFAAFSCFWTVLPFLLARPPYGYGPGTIGLFGIIGVTGVAAAPVAGRLSDSGRGDLSIAAGLALIVISVAGLWLWQDWLPGVIAATILFDLGSTANHISNQARVHAIRPEARNRINTIYMVSYFLGGSAGSIAGAWAWMNAGWTGFCIVAALFALAGLSMLVFCHRIEGINRNPSRG